MTKFKKMREPDPYNIDVHPLVRMMFHECNRRRIPQRDIAECIGINPLTIQRWAQGSGTPTLQHFSAWCDMMGYELLMRRRDYDSDSI